MPTKRCPPPSCPSIQKLLKTIYNEARKLQVTNQIQYSCLLNFWSLMIKYIFVVEIKPHKHNVINIFLFQIKIHLDQTLKYSNFDKELKNQARTKILNKRLTNDNGFGQELYTNEIQIWILIQAPVHLHFFLSFSISYSSCLILTIKGRSNKL